MKRVALLATLAFGCGGSRPAHIDTVPSAERFAAAQAAVRAAEEVGAKNYPKAELYLRYATEQLGTARSLMGQNDGRASLLFLRATADAEVALALARASQAQAEADRAKAGGK